MRYIQCTKCYTLNMESLGHCQQCGQAMRLSSNPSAAVHSFPTGNWEHLGPDPIYIKNRRQLRQVCDENGVRANILD